MYVLYLITLATVVFVVFSLTHAIAAIFFGTDIVLWLQFQMFRLRIWTRPNYLNASLIRVLEPAQRDYALERFGYDRYIQSLQIKPDNYDERYGYLYKFNILNERYTVVRVINASPEDDNSYSVHYLRVPNHIRFAHEAVAWTFHLTTKEYDPDIET